MSWLKKKKPNPEDGDFPAVPKHYRENEGKKLLTKPAKLAPALEWNGGVTVVWGIDVGPRVTTVSFAYLLPGQGVEVHNIVYWPKVFPLRESDNFGEPLPGIKEKTCKARETYESVGFVSHPAWLSEKTANYVHILGAANSPSAFQVRTELPFIELASERYKYVDLVEHLLKHALSVYGAVIKPGQPQWSHASDVVVSLPSGISKSAEISVVDALNRMIQRVLPKVIGLAQVYYVSRADLRPFEDDTWRNIDTDFQPNDVFMIVDWDLMTGDMVCVSYKVRQLPSGQVAFDIRQRSYLQSTPVTKKREVSADGKEGVRFANALHWVAQQKHATQKIIIRASNPFKKSEGLLDSFHKTLTELGLQVGVRLVDPTAETGAFGAVLWRIAHVIASSDQSNGEDVQLVRDATIMSSRETSPSTPVASDLEFGKSSKNSRVTSSYHTERGSRPVSIAEPPPAFVSTPISWTPPSTLPAAPVTRNSHLLNGQAEVEQTAENTAGPSSTPGSPEHETTDLTTLPPSYIVNNDTKSCPPEKTKTTE
ncbi:hypothetical protein RSOL_333970 [Rhizoctonia solani AG-3 Rhs1AP]|uniref:Uncharacterized protein n=1 Tax=Rhizoctonia solani AG-3 Rhs1AP TaxID=1086054 RepID=X8JBD8_9AGAM|nr:hypothetical protein RSOL_333970 [Rhizoctonia solani AG-3 Rhs1AP]